MVRLQQATKEGLSVNLQHALDTLRHRHVELLNERARFQSKGLRHQFVVATGEMLGVEYAIEVLEAALEDGK